MERLTEQFMYGLGHKDCYDACSVCDVAECCDSLEEMLEKLAHYEDLEEQGLLTVIDNETFQRDDLDRCTHRHCNKCDKYRRDLQRYKDLEDKGRLIELPCLPNEEVWELNKRFGTHKTMYASREAIVGAIEAGYAIGYTQEAAEAKLTEMEGAE